MQGAALCFECVGKRGLARATEVHVRSVSRPSNEGPPPKVSDRVGRGTRSSRVWPISCQCHGTRQPRHFGSVETSVLIRPRRVLGYPRALSRGSSAGGDK